MAMNYRLAFMMRDRRHDFELAVREKVWNRIGEIFDDPNGPTRPSPFTVMRTVDGRCVALNLTEVQAVSHLYDPAIAPSDSTVYEGPILFQLKGRHKPLDEWTCSDESLADLIAGLEHGPEVVPIVRMLDGDGEVLRLNPHELVYVMAPAQWVDAGYEAFERDSSP